MKHFVLIFLIYHETLIYRIVIQLWIFFYVYINSLFISINFSKKKTSILHSTFFFTGDVTLFLSLSFPNVFKPTAWSSCHLVAQKFFVISNELGTIEGKDAILRGIARGEKDKRERESDEARVASAAVSLAA